MTKGTSRGVYAALAVLELARAQKQKSALAAGEIAARHDLSERFMTTTLQTLRRSGLVRSIRGSQGGFELVPKPNEVTLGYVLSLVEPPVQAPKPKKTVSPEPARERRKRANKPSGVQKADSASRDRGRILQAIKEAEEKKQEYLNGILFSELLDGNAVVDVLHFEI